MTKMTLTADEIEPIKAADYGDPTAGIPERPPLARMTPPMSSPTSHFIRGLKLETLEDMWRFAKFVIAAGDYTPKGFSKPESIFVAIQMGAEVGMGPMASLQNIAVINGRPTLYGDALLAVARSSPAWDESGFMEWTSGEGESLEAMCQVRRKGGNLIKNSFSVKDAKLAGLWGKAGPWKSYPERMLKWRARGFSVRDGFSDVLKGFISFEEARDMDPVVHTEVISEGDKSTPPLKIQKTLESITPKREKKARALPAPIDEMPPPPVSTPPPSATLCSADLQLKIANAFTNLTVSNRNLIKQKYSLKGMVEIKDWSAESANDLWVEIKDLAAAPVRA